MSKFKAAGFRGRLSSLFMGQKQPDGDIRELKDFIDGTRIISVGALILYKKRIETSNYLEVHRIIGWALDYFLQREGKTLYNLKSFTLVNFGNGVEIVAECFINELTSESDYEKWFRKLIDGYRTLPTTCGGYQYWPRGTTWDEMEILGEIEAG